jgi:hypothetical protein
MARINRIKRILRGDFKSEFHPLIDRLGYVLNSFMQEVETQINGNLDIDNLASDVITFKIKVDGTGVPVGNNLVKSTVLRPSGTTVISATNEDDGDAFPTSQPFISFTTGTNSTVMKIRNISGLQADADYTLTVQIF